LELPNIQDWLEATTAEVAAAMSSPPAPDSAVSKRIGELMNEGMAGKSLATLDSLFEYVAVARGLHQAAAIARQNADPEWPELLSCMAQDFLGFASDDIARLVVIARAEASSLSLAVGSVH
jgi:hypothetical protein